MKVVTQVRVGVTFRDGSKLWNGGGTASHLEYMCKIPSPNGMRGSVGDIEGQDSGRWQI